MLLDVLTFKVFNFLLALSAFLFIVYLSVLKLEKIRQVMQCECVIAIWSIGGLIAVAISSMYLKELAVALSVLVMVVLIMLIFNVQRHQRGEFNEEDYN